MALVVNLEEMAAKLGVSLPTMRKLAGYDGFPVIERGKLGVPWQLDPEAVIAFVQDRRAREHADRLQRDELLAQVALPFDEAASPEGALSPADRVRIAQARLKEAELAKQAGFLVGTTEMRTRLTECWLSLAQMLAALPGSLGRRHNLPDPVIRDMRQYIEGQQREMHRRMRDLLEPHIRPPAEDADEAA